MNQVNVRFTGGAVVKNLPADAGEARVMGLIPGSGRSPGKGNGTPLQYSCLENPMDGGTWLGYSPWCHKELDTTERLHSLTHSLRPSYTSDQLATNLEISTNTSDSVIH